MSTVTRIDGGPSPLVNVGLTQAEAESLACLCQAVRGSKVKSRKVHTDKILQGLLAVGIAIVPKTEFEGIPYFKANKLFDQPL